MSHPFQSLFSTIAEPLQEASAPLEVSTPEFEDVAAEVILAEKQAHEELAPFPGQAGSENPFDHDEWQEPEDANENTTNDSFEEILPDEGFNPFQSFPQASAAAPVSDHEKTAVTTPQHNPFQIQLEPETEPAVTGKQSVNRQEDETGNHDNQPESILSLNFNDESENEEQEKTQHPFVPNFGFQNTDFKKTDEKEDEQKQTIVTKVSVAPEYESFQPEPSAQEIQLPQNTQFESKLAQAPAAAAEFVTTPSTSTLPPIPREIPREMPSAALPAKEPALQAPVQNSTETKKNRAAVILSGMLANPANTNLDPSVLIGRLAEILERFEKL